MVAPKQIYPTTAKLYLSHTATQTPTPLCRNLPLSLQVVRRNATRLQRPASAAQHQQVRRLPVRVIRNLRRCSRVRLRLVSSIIRSSVEIFVILLHRNSALRWIRSVAFHLLFYIDTFLYPFVIAFLAKLTCTFPFSSTYGIPLWAPIAMVCSWGITSA